MIRKCLHIHHAVSSSASPGQKKSCLLPTGTIPPPTPRCLPPIRPNVPAGHFYPPVEGKTNQSNQSPCNREGLISVIITPTGPKSRKINVANPHSRFIYAAVHKILVEYISQPNTVKTSFFLLLLYPARFTSIRICTAVQLGARHWSSYGVQIGKWPIHWQRTQRPASRMRAGAAIDHITITSMAAAAAAEWKRHSGAHTPLQRPLLY